MSALHGTCQNCRHFATLDRQCRARSPVPQLAPKPNGELVVIGMWPAALKEQWCGEWVSDKAAEQRLRLAN